MLDVTTNHDASKIAADLDERVEHVYDASALIETVINALDDPEVDLSPDAALLVGSAVRTLRLAKREADSGLEAVAIAINALNAYSKPVEN